MATYAPCRSCKAQVTWGKTAKSGKPMPLDPSDDRGNALIDGTGRVHVFKDPEAARAAALADEMQFGVDPQRYISHHAEGQCPKGRAWQGKTRKDPDAPDPAPVQESLL